MSGLADPPQTEKQIEEKVTQQQLERARKILAIYYLSLPFVLVYLLFKIFPPQPWPNVEGNLVTTTIYFLRGMFPVETSLEERLLLLVIVAGALGSYIHSATSYVDYRGNRQFTPSWLLWYLARPFIGVCLALVVYFAVRGGLLLLVVNGSAATEAKNINPFGVAAVAGLTGMFSKQAADKLAEVFSTLFKSQGDEKRSDSLTPAPAPALKIDPAQGSATGGTNVTITGTGFVAGATVSFGSNGATNVKVVNETTLTADTPAGEGVVAVTVTNADGQKKTATQAYTYIADGDEVRDAHDVELKDDTLDEHLPITEGGVA